MYIAITAGLVLLFSFYIVYDTRMIMERFGFDDYIIAAVILYVDIINLFLKILALMGSRNWLQTTPLIKFDFLNLSVISRFKLYFKINQFVG